MDVFLIAVIISTVCAAVLSKKKPLKACFDAAAKAEAEKAKAKAEADKAKAKAEAEADKKAAAAEKAEAAAAEKAAEKAVAKAAADESLALDLFKLEVRLESERTKNKLLMQFIKQHHGKVVLFGDEALHVPSLAQPAATAAKRPRPSGAQPSSSEGEDQQHQPTQFN